MKILILNCYSRNSLAVINSLYGSHELIGADENTRFISPEIILKTSRLSKVLRYTNPQKDINLFQRDLEHICHDEGINAIIPTGTTSTNYLSKCKQALAEKGVMVAVDDYDKLNIIADKWLSYKYCTNLSVTMPRTILLDGTESAFLDMGTLGLPIVLKPRSSYASKGVVILKTQTELSEFTKLNADINTREPDFINSSYIAQEYIDGTFHDGVVFAQDGQPITLYTQQRVQSLYDFGGGGIMNLSTDEPDIKEHMQNIAAGCGWNGIIMADFIRDKSGKVFLIECNPKVWGTTQLAISAGLDLPTKLVDLFFENKKLNEDSSYKVGYLYRWYFPEIIYHWLHWPTWKIACRFKKTMFFKDYKKKFHNLRMFDLKHLLGMIFNF